MFLGVPSVVWVLLETLRISSDGADWSFMGGLKFSIPVIFGYENFDLRGYFFAHSKQSEVVILHNASDETEDVLGCLECC